MVLEGDEDAPSRSTCDVGTGTVDGVDDPLISCGARFEPELLTEDRILRNMLFEDPPHPILDLSVRDGDGIEA